MSFTHVIFIPIFKRFLRINDCIIAVQSHPGVSLRPAKILSGPVRRLLKIELRYQSHPYHEYGIGYDIGKRQAKKYQSYGLTKGVSVAADGSITVGLWAGEFKTGYAQGYVVSFPVGWGIDGGVGIWSDYYTPKRADGLNQPHFIGLTASFGVGSGFEIGEYNEVWTKVK